MQIALLTSSYPRFPQDHLGCFIRELASEIVKIGDIQIKVVTPEDARVYPDFKEEEIEVRRFRYFFPRQWQRLACGNGIPENLENYFLAWLQVPFFMLSYMGHAWQTARSSDLLWAHWLVPSGLVGAVLKFLLGKPLVITVHSSDVHFMKEIALGRMLLKFIIRQADRVTVVCHFVADELRKLLCEEDRELLDEKLDVIPMGVTARTPSPSRGASDSEDLVILYLGRLVKIKGVEILIKALDGIQRKTRQSLRLCIVGEGLEKERLKQVAAEKEIPTDFLGNLGGERKIAALNRADIVVIPSLMLGNGRTEGLPVTLLEALASGRAVIASEVGGIPEVIQDGWNGLLVPPGDSRRLTQCLAELIGNPVKRASLGKNALLTSRSFNLAGIGGRFVDVFTRLSPGNPAHLETVASSETS